MVTMTVCKRSQRSEPFGVAEPGTHGEMRAHVSPCLARPRQIRRVHRCERAPKAARRADHRLRGLLSTFIHHRVLVEMREAEALAKSGG